MIDNIHLNTFPKKTKYESDSEQYHEIDQNTVLEESSFSHPTPLKHISSYDFFTQHDVKIKEKCKTKNKKHKNVQPLGIMDIINTELSSTVPLIRENVIELVKYDKDLKCFYNNVNLKNILQWQETDLEQGWNLKSRSSKLSPIFPKILENTTVKSYPINVHYIEPVMFNDLIADYTVADDSMQSQKFLDFEMRNITFKHHHKFTLEILLLTKMIELYNEYLITQKLLKELYRNVKVSRETKNNLRHQLLQITSNNKENVRFDKTLLKYTKKLFYYKELYMDELKKLKELIHNLLSLWSDVEMVREKTKKIDLNYYLKVSKTIVSDDDYEKEWDNVFETEYSDMLDKIEYEYVRAYIEYKETKNRSNHVGFNKTITEKPKLQVDEVKIKAETEVIVGKILEKQKIGLLLKQDKRTTSELLRPVQALIANDYYFKVFVDNVFVCESELYTCKEPMLNLEMSETFSVQILRNNEIVQIVLYENDTNVSTMKIIIEQMKKNIGCVEHKPYVFKYDLDIYPSNKYVGSGYGIKEIAAESKVRLKSGNIFKGKLCTTCEVIMKIGWNETFNENNIEIMLASMQIGRKIKSYFQGIEKPGIDNLVHIINDVYDTDIENNESMVNALQSVCKTNIINHYTFLMEDKNDCVRLKLLHLRNSGGFFEQENKLVPLFASQISTEQLSNLQHSDESLKDMLCFNNDNDTDPIDLQRYLGVKYVQKLNEKLQRTVNEFLLQKTRNDVVKDFQDLSLRGLLTNQINLMTLSVSYFVTRQQLMKECIAKDQEIHVTVHRAFNLPVRSTEVFAKSDEDASERIAGFKLRPLRPYVKLSYHTISGQSAPGIGCFPTWNQTIKLRTKLYPFSSIHVNVYDECKMNVRTVDGTEPSSSGTVQYQRCGRWLGTLLVPISTVLTLGTLRGTFKLTSPPSIIGYDSPTAKETKTLIPEVKQMMKKDISFLALQISTSLSHHGGVQAYSRPIPAVSEDDRTIKHLNSFLTQFMNLFPSRNISLTYVDSSGRNKCVTDFLQPIPPPEMESFPKDTKSSGSAVSKSSVLSESSSSRSSGKKDENTSSPAEEKTPKYDDFDSLNWRNDEYQLTKVINLCLRYVSLVPTYEVTDAQVVTMTGLESLRVMYGSPVDHTILLASYFLYLGIKCWIVTGMALPRGVTTYLLLKYDLSIHKYVTVADHVWKVRGFFNKREDYVWHIFDAVAGERFELRDVVCPLKTVSYVYDDENIWVNVQTSTDCESVSFDFSKSADWQQIFATSRAVQKQTLLTAVLYRPPSDVERLQAALEAKIRSKVQKWRPRAKTIWNRYCCTLLRETLPQWEYWSFNSTDRRPAVGQRLKQLMLNYKMFGFPLNMHYVNTKTVLANVKATEVYSNEDPDVEFALATQVFAYPNNVISVWVYFASISKI